MLYKCRLNDSKVWNIFENRRKHAKSLAFVNAVLNVDKTNISVMTLQRTRTQKLMNIEQSFGRSNVLSDTARQKMRVTSCLMVKTILTFLHRSGPLQVPGRVRSRYLWNPTPFPSYGAHARISLPPYTRQTRVNVRLLITFQIFAMSDSFTGVIIITDRTDCTDRHHHVM